MLFALRLLALKKKEGPLLLDRCIFIMTFSNFQTQQFCYILTQI